MRTSTRKHVSVTITFGHRLMARLALVLLVGGCGTMQMQRVELRPQSLDSGLIVHVWSHGKVLEWTSVVITADSVTGTSIGALNSTRRTGLPLTAVDSMLFARRGFRPLCGSGSGTVCEFVVTGLLLVPILLLATHT